MSLWRQFSRGLRGLTGRAAADRDDSDEVAHYVEQATAANIARGLSPAEARREALLHVGNTTNVREQMRGAGWEASIESFFTDLRYAARVLRKSPVFAIVTIFVIALGTGAVTTIFSATNAMLLRPLPGARDAAALFSIDRKHSNGKEGMSASYPYYEQLRDKSHSFDGVAAWHDLPLTVTSDGAGKLAYGNVVSGNYFSVLGVRPEIGRFFAPEEDRTPLTHPVMVISDGFWRSEFGADSSIVGKTVQVNGHPFTIIGVVPRTFRSVYIPLKSDAWIPLMMLPQLKPGYLLTDVSDNPLRLFARLKPGVGVESARQEVGALTAAWVASGIEPMPWAKNYIDGRLVPLSGLPEDATKAIVGFFFLLLGASSLVLLIASVNVAAMLSARAVARGREMAVRAALGARRGRLVRQLLTESLLLFALGAAGGIAIAIGATRALQQLPLPDEISLDLAPDYRVIGFALIVALITGVVFGLAPALRAARTDISKRIRDDSPSGGVRRSAAGNALVVGQLALSLLLLVAAGLFLRALERGNRIDPGFDATGVSVATLNAESWGYDTVQARAFFAALRARLEATPGVATVSYTDVAPLTAQSSGGRMRLDGPDAAGATDDAGSGTIVRANYVDADFFTALRIPIVHGEPIRRSDDERSGKIAVINQALAAKISAGGNALGRTFTYNNEKITVAGIARDAKYAWLTEDPALFIYFPIAQHWMPRQVVLVRGGLPANQMALAIERAVQSIDRGLPPPVVTTLREANSIVLLPQRVAAMVTGALGAIGLIMATVGLYGIISYSVNRRRREIGIRVALGARQADVLGMVVREGMKLAMVGVAIGLLLAAAATRLMSSFLFNVSPLDAMTFAGMSALFLGIAFVSSYLPARRAASSDPMTALRTD
jgi:predicted permease